MSALCWIVLLSAFGWHSEAVFTRPNEIKLENNEYTDVLVAINENIPEDQQIVDRIELGVKPFKSYSVNKMRNNAGLQGKHTNDRRLNEQTLLCPNPCLSQTVPGRAQNGTQPDCPELSPEVLSIIVIGGTRHGLGQGHRVSRTVLSPQARFGTRTDTNRDTSRH
ncbi:chloride channel [Branchiostoma belcheri]|nr:chloride channel [Branchiostoma belcheri]